MHRVSQYLPEFTPAAVISPTVEKKRCPPPPSGSIEEFAETALAVGWLGAFGPTCDRVAQIIHTRLLREW